MIDREKSRLLAARFDGQPGAPRTDAGWCNLINAIESAGSEYSAGRVVARLLAGKYVPTPADVLKALKAYVRCTQCDDTGWVNIRNAKRTCPCVGYGLPPGGCHNCGGKGFTLGDAVDLCHCAAAKAPVTQVHKELDRRQKAE